MTTGPEEETVLTIRSKNLIREILNLHYRCNIRKSMTTNGLYGGNDNSFSNFNNRSGLRSSGGISSDPAVGRRVEGLEQRLSQQDSANRGILEQLMKVQQDFKMEMKKHEQAILEERNQRLRMEQTLNGMTTFHRSDNDHIYLFCRSSQQTDRH